MRTRSLSVAADTELYGELWQSLCSSSPKESASVPFMLLLLLSLKMWWLLRKKLLKGGRLQRHCTHVLMKHVFPRFCSPTSPRTCPRAGRNVYEC
jgi:hypothetical protein